MLKYKQGVLLGDILGGGKSMCEGQECDGPTLVLFILLFAELL